MQTADSPTSSFDIIHTACRILHVAHTSMSRCIRSCQYLKRCNVLRKGWLIIPQSFFRIWILHKHLNHIRSYLLLMIIVIFSHWKVHDIFHLHICNYYRLMEFKDIIEFYIPWSWLKWWQYAKENNVSWCILMLSRRHRSGLDDEYDSNMYQLAGGVMLKAAPTW